MSDDRFTIQQEDVESDGLALREYWNILAKRLWTVVLVFVVVVTGVGLYTLRQPKVYQAATTLIIDFQQSRVLGNAVDDDFGQPMDWYTHSQYFETQLRVISSRHVAERVVEDEELADNLEFLGLSGISDQDMLARALEASDPAATLMSTLLVTPVPDTRMVTIEVMHSNPELAAELANAVAEAYQEQNIEHRLHAMDDAFQWLETQYSTYEDKVRESSQALHQFKVENPLLFTNPAEQQLLTNHKIENINQRLIDVEVERRKAGYLLAELKTFKVEHVASSGMSLLADAPNLTTLSNRYIDLRQKERELLKTFLESSGEVLSLRDQITLIGDAITAEVKSIRRAYQSRYDALRKSEQDLRAQLAGVTVEAQKLDHLELLFEQVESQRSEQQRLFELVQKRLNDVSLTKLLDNNNIRILDRATTPTHPTKPRVMFNLILGAVFGLLGGVALAFLVEMLDTTVKGQDDIERGIAMPFLGVIPIIREKDGKPKRKTIADVPYVADLHVGFYPKSKVAECTRTIRTNILFMSPNATAQVLLVTSPSPLEGKTTTAINLATVMAQSNSKVLMIEADMRRPRLHRAFSLKPKAGLSDVLIEAATLDDVILPTAFKGLDLLPCGPLPPNPSELFHTTRFSAVLDELRTRYDRILIDSPPVIAVTDAMVLAQHADGVIVVARAGSTRKEMLKRTKQLLDGINAPLLGAILNNVNLDSRRYGRHYYYYAMGQHNEDDTSPP